MLLFKACLQQQFSCCRAVQLPLFLFQQAAWHGACGHMHASEFLLSPHPCHQALKKIKAVLPMCGT
jgi:hypothetical protein